PVSQIVPKRIDAVRRDIRIEREIGFAVEQTLLFQEIALPPIMPGCRKEAAQTPLPGRGFNQQEGAGLPKPLGILSRPQCPSFLFREQPAQGGYLLESL